MYKDVRSSKPLLGNYSYFKIALDSALLRCKPDFSLNIMNVKEKEVPAKFVPAAAVTRMGQVLFILTRRKGLLGG